MKKTFGKLAAIVLAFLMIFSLTGCGMVKVENSTKALEGAVDAMLGESYITASADFSYAVGSPDMALTYASEFKLVKGNNDYDYSFDIKYKMGGLSLYLVRYIKKGDKLYDYDLSTQKYGVESAAKVTTDGLGDTVKDFISNLDLAALKKDGKTYVISTEQDYSSAINGFVSGLLSIKDEDAGEFLAHGLGVTKDDLGDFIDTAFADNKTLSEFVVSINALLGALAPEDNAITVEALMSGVDAETLYSVISMIDYTVAAPTANQTGYSWLMSVWGNKQVDEILAILDELGNMIGGDGEDNDWENNWGEDGDYWYGDGEDDENWGYGYSLSEEEDEQGPLTVAELRAMLKEALGLDGGAGYTIGELYDEFAYSFDDLVLMLMDTLGSYDALEAMLESGGPLLGVDNLQNIKANKLGYSVKIVLNGKDLTFKSINVAANADVTYLNYGLAYFNASLNVNFNYDKISISAPSQSLLA